MLLYDSTLHVPLIVSGDGVPKARVSRQVRHVDIVPTVLDLVGLPVPAGMDGQSLVPLWKAGAGDRPGDAPLSYAETRFGELHFGWAPLASGRDGQWKYVDAPGGELYDLRNDPRETDNRVEAQHDTAAGLSRALRQVGSTDAQPRPSADADAAERLRSLGYASGRNEIGNPGANPRTEIARYEAYVKTFNAGLEQLEGNDARGAEQTFRSLARQFPRAFEAHQYLARALASRRAYADAAAEYELALTLNATEPALYFDAARALAADRRFDRAFELVKEGRRRDPGSFYGPLAEGFVAAAAGDTDRAERAFDDALARNPGLAAAHFELGHLAESKNDRARAEAEYQKALDADPSMTPARLAVERLQSRNR
jgi:tetratricopeptide (TPR) repeat protein